MSRLQLTFICVAVAVIVDPLRMTGRSQQGPTPLDARADLHVDLPLRATGWISAIGRIEKFERTPVGLELAPDDISSLSRDQAGSMLVLTGLSLTDAVHLLSQHDGRYAARFVNGVLNVRPLRAIDSRDDFLNRRLPRFKLDELPVSEALHAVHQALDPAYRRPPQRSDRLDLLDQRTPGRGTQVRAALARPITVNLTDVTVRDVLNAVAMADGEMWWCVTYQRNLGAYPESTITFAGFDNWTIAAQAHSRIGGLPRDVRPGGR